jgi:hypothetical protein
MRKILLNIFLLLTVITLLTGCSNSDKEVLPQENKIVEVERFIEKYEIEDTSNFEFKFLGSIDGGSSLFNIYDKALEQEQYTLEVLDMTILGTSTGEISKYDLFIYNEGDIYELETAIEYNLVNTEELRYIIPKEMVQEKVTEESDFGKDIIYKLYTEKIIDSNHNLTLDKATIENMLSLNPSDYVWAEMSISRDVIHLEDVLIIKYDTEAQKEAILERLELRKNMHLETRPGNTYYEDGYANEFIIEKDNLIVYCASELASSQIKEYVENYLNK